MIERTPLHDWLSRKLGQEPTQDSLAGHQLARLRETLAYVRERSPYHRQRLAGLAEGFPQRLEDMARLPFTSPDDLRRHHLDMLCVSRDQVARVVTLRTSGTTAPPKRVYFSDRDLELTLDFFQHGMSTMVEPGECVLILLPGGTPDSVGDLLARALARLRVRAVAHGPVVNPALTLDQAERQGAHCLVGIPVQALALAEHPGAERLRGRLKSALLTTDYVPRALAARVRRAWGCEIFEHYGMTETGLGGGVDCRAHAGYHLRGADLYYEVVQPASGSPLPPGEEGELVVTTLTRQAMPLLRYRTGDMGRLLPESCPCGGVTPRLERVRGRLGNHMQLPGGARLPMWRLDETLFAVAGLLDYRIRLTADGGAWRLQLTAQASPGGKSGLAHEIRRALAAIPELGQGLATGGIKLEPIKIANQAWASDGTSKRTL